MNIMVVSDDHGLKGFKEAYEEACNKYGSIEAVIHAGDTERSDNSYYMASCNVPIYMVRGNNDFNGTPESIEFELAGKKFFVTHGHRYSVYMGMQGICYAAMEKKADIVIFGHTHHAYHQEWKGVQLINPGSLTGVRSGKGSYVVLSISDKISVNFNYLEID